MFYQYLIGQIAFIGETKFAPGEWAGIVLDSPVGKNDGSVAGVRYFQCEAKRGVFARLAKLTRAPAGIVYWQIKYDQFYEVKSPATKLQCFLRVSAT